MEPSGKIRGLWIALFCCLAGSLSAEPEKPVPTPSTATHIARSINSRIYARLLLFRRSLVPALESDAQALNDGTLFYTLRSDPELAAQQVAVFKRNGELLVGQAETRSRLPLDVHKALDLSNGLGFLLRPRGGDRFSNRYELFYPISGSDAENFGDWSWVLFFELDIQRALPQILEKLRLLRSDNVLLYSDPEQIIFNWREDLIDFSASRSFDAKRTALHEITLTDLMRSDDSGEHRLTFLKQSPPQLVDSLVSWDNNVKTLGSPWIVVHSAKAYDEDSRGKILTGEWVAVDDHYTAHPVRMAMLTESSNFKMVLERSDAIFFSEGRYLNNSLTAHQTTIQKTVLKVLSLSGQYKPESNQLSIRLVIQEEGKVKVFHYLFARSEKRAYKEKKAGRPQIKLRAFH